MAETWLKCTECKSEIAFGVLHYVCSVSTCKRSKMRLVFCSVVCWDSHLSVVRHRDAWAEEARAPTKDAWQRELAAAAAESPAPRTPTPAFGVGVKPTMPVARPAQSSVVTRPVTNDATQRIAGAVPPAPSPSRPPPTPDSVQPPRPGPAPTADSVQPPRSGPAPTADSVQPPRPGVPVPPRPAVAQPAPTPVPVRRVVGEASPVVAAALEGNVTLSDVVDKDVLIVVSKMKKYIKDRSGMNCSDSVADALSEHVRLLCDDAIRAAARDERKTVLDRDVTRPRR